MLKKALTLLFLGLLPASVLAEEDFAAMLDRVKQLKDEGNYSAALGELNWVSQELSKLHTKKIEGFFPAELVGFKREKVESSSAMGLMNIESRYAGADSSVNITLVGSASAGGPASGLGSFAGMAQMAAMMGNVPGTEVVRVAGKRATVQDEGGSKKLMLTLSEGNLLTIEAAKGSVTSEQLQSLASGLDIKAMEDYLKAE